MERDKANTCPLAHIGFCVMRQSIRGEKKTIKRYNYVYHTALTDKNAFKNTKESINNVIVVYKDRRRTSGALVAGLWSVDD